MKYSKILGSSNRCGGISYLSMGLVCGKCRHELCGEEKFCPECGHKLLRLERKIPEDFILGILNGKAISGSVITKPTDDASIPNKVDNGVIDASTAKDDLDVSTDVQQIGSGESHDTIKCPYGHNSATCGHCTGKGACDMEICTSIPPQYRMCPFHGSGFIFCKDAD